MVPRKAAKLEIFGWKFSESLLRTNDCKFGKLWDEKFGVFSRPGWMTQAYAMLDFVYDPLTFSHTLLFVKNKALSAKSNPVFQ